MYWNSLFYTTSLKYTEILFTIINNKIKAQKHFRSWKKDMFGIFGKKSTIEILADSFSVPRVIN